MLLRIVAPRNIVVEKWRTHATVTPGLRASVTPGIPRHGKSVHGFGPNNVPAARTACSLGTSLPSLSASFPASLPASRMLGMKVPVTEKRHRLGGIGSGIAKSRTDRENVRGRAQLCASFKFGGGGGGGGGGGEFSPTPTTHTHKLKPTHPDPHSLTK
jgi:hypothetical protein